MYFCSGGIFILWTGIKKNASYFLIKKEISKIKEKEREKTCGLISTPDVVFI